MPLTDSQIKALRPSSKPIKKADGHGLYIEVAPTGSKLWRIKYRLGGIEKRLSLGAYPTVSLAEARRRREELRAQKDEGLDPSLERKRRKAAAKISAEDNFTRVAEEYIDKRAKEGMAESTLIKLRWFHSLLKDDIGSLPVSEVDPHLLLASLKRIEAKGNYETAKKARSFASRVFRYAVITSKAKADPAALLGDALIRSKSKHYAAILEPAKLGELLRAIDAYCGSPVTRLALQIAPHVFVRPGELRHADWAEIDLVQAVWKIPAGKMKARREHAVPLSPQVLRLFRELHDLTGPTGFAFPALHTGKRPMSGNTLNVAFRRMGFTKEEITGHGLRSTASTLLNESGKWNPDAIERALAHGPSNAVRGAYHRGTYWQERVEMAKWWSDHLDALKSCAGK